MPTDMFTRNKSPNQTGSHSKALTMGMNMGIVTIMIATCSIKVPIKSSISIMTRRMAKGGKLNPKTNFRSPWLAPVYARIWPKAVAPVRIMNIITVI